ncbi:DUF6270 domain-containing protein [Psychrobacter sp. Pi2-1]|uniref:DUF6270 domain-containing protein n=1 Tax=Psychrobacter sp. Pi2-1 TaxID=2774131 RepID=UPI00191A5B6D|nr:DUF6270 domain-containing protein [Psychrobacter sp. Pi2-1]
MERSFYIYGSCVSRDGFSSIDKRELNPVGYTARYSLARLIYPKVHNNYDLSLLKSQFQKRILKRELLNSLFDDISQADPDFIILDFIDDRFGLIEIEEGIFVTNSFELRKSKACNPESSLVTAKNDEFFSVWKLGVDKFLDFVKEKDLLDKVIVNAVFWANIYEDGAEIKNYPSIHHDSQEYIKSFNDLLTRQYDYLATKLKPNQFIYYPEELILANANHKWGKSPFHYSDKLYKFFLKKIDEYSFSLLKREGFKRWNKKTYFDISEEELFGLIPKNETAAYSINYNSIKAPLDILFRGFSKNNIRKYKKILVSLNGAITNRSEKSNPFFSKMDLSTELSPDLPFIAFSDPSLYLSKELSLAWYNGNHLFPDITSAIARILDNIVNLYSEYNCEIVLCGGSGAGYAILNLLNHMKNDNKASALIWNPQIILSEYNLNAFKKYLDCCFPNLSPENYKLKRDLRELALVNGINEEIECNINSKIIILMNENDHKHIFKHVSKFVQKCSLSQSYTCGHNYLFFEDNIKIIFGSWGKGHAVPHRENIKYFLTLLLQEKFDAIGEKEAQEVPLSDKAALNNCNLLELKDEQWLKMLSVEYDKETSEVQINFNIDKYFSVYNLVYYVVHEGKAIKSAWDTKRTKLVFKVEGYPAEELKVRIYIRNIFGKQRIISKGVCN